MSTLGPDEIARYARHIVLPEIGGAGQQRLKAARVMMIGAGGLGSPCLMYLAAAGIGMLHIVDDDAVDLSNLQRQVLHGTGDVGARKTASAAAALTALNPEIEIVCHDLRLAPDNVSALVAEADLVADGSDNFATRYLLNDACVAAGKTLVSAAMHRFEGQLTTIRPGGPCLRCIHPEPPAPGTVPDCSEAGVLGAMAGVLGAMQAVEVVKEILGLGESLSGRLVLYDALGQRLEEIAVARDPACRACAGR